MRPWIDSILDYSRCVKGVTDVGGDVLAAGLGLPILH